MMGERGHNPLVISYMFVQISNEAPVICALICECEGREILRTVIKKMRQMSIDVVGLVLCVLKKGSNTLTLSLNVSQF